MKGSHLQSQCWLSTCGSHCDDGKDRHENLQGCGHHWLSAPSCRSRRNGSSSESCLDILGNEREDVEEQEGAKEEKNRSQT